MDRKNTIMTDSSISKDDEEIRVALYANIGFFIQISQMLEYNLRKLICFVKSIKEIENSEITKKRVDEICKKYDEYYTKTYTNKSTLGKLINEVKNLSQFKPEIIKILKEINDYRIVVVHVLFQNNIHNNLLANSDNVLEYIKKRLIPTINDVENINHFVLNIIGLYQEDLHKYKKVK